MATNKQGDNGRRQSSGRRLVGWLVSYADDDLGSAHELWAGRTIISSQRTAGTHTIEVDVGGVSSPHLAMNASNKHRVVVQDIFSDQGSYVLKNTDSQERPVNGPVELEHGDWIRIGKQVRFQVCLIDGPTR